MITNKTNKPKALISGAGFAGLTTAFWMHKLGYRVTVVETGVGVKKGGTPVDIRDETIAIVDRMGILSAIRDKTLPPRRIDFVNCEGVVDVSLDPSSAREDLTVDEYEIPRDDLLAILFATLENDIEVRFENSITELTDTADGVRAVFRDGSQDEFAVVLGCDGNHSTVRRLRFGPEADYSRFLRNYFTVSIVDELLIEQDTTRILSVPGRTLMLNAYDDKTDVCFMFHAAEELEYDYHDVHQQKQIVRAHVADLGTQFAGPLDKADSADNFYFDKLSQTAMPRWTSGRVALVGDAGYCASPAAGMGGSLAIIGATALYDAFVTADGDIGTAFELYESDLRPVVERIHATAVDFGLATYFPETQEAIDTRNALLSGT